MELKTEQQYNALPVSQQSGFTEFEAPDGQKYHVRYDGPAPAAGRAGTSSAQYAPIPTPSLDVGAMPGPANQSGRAADNSSTQSRPKANPNSQSGSGPRTSSNPFTKKNS